ncbi:MAG: hypothetical protein EOP56_17420 [Sphingobacteriales bacterium]|nr:MAG: hypothetical protein EOP56_17420 [Sphingobacteriales bacterium]
MYSFLASDRYKWLRVLAIATIVSMILYGAVICIFEIKPFWLDEWCVIYNLKTMTVTELGGKLEKGQQFPRFYLQVLKCIVQPFDYSYTSLRLPSFFVHAFGLIFCYFLSGRIFGKDDSYRFFWLLIYASYSTSVEYFVQIKQYTMEMLLTLVALWQLLELLNTEANKIRLPRFLFLCLVSAIIPFFSYTYPLCFAALCLSVVLHTRGFKNIFIRSIPLFIGSVGVVVFYIFDVTQVMADQGMREFWKDYILRDGFQLLPYLHNVYSLFGHLGTGVFFEIIYGTLGLAGFFHALYQQFKRRSYTSPFQYIVQYSSFLVIIAIVLASLHKLPLGVHRLNAFAVPTCGILVINMLMVLEQKWKKAIPVVYTILSLALAGNIYQAFAKAHFSEEAVKKQRIYDNSKAAISVAENKHIPIVTTPAVFYPHEDRDGDFAVICHPAYHMKMSLPVYNAVDTPGLKKIFEDHPELQQLVFIDRYEHSVVQRGAVIK